MKKKEFFKQAKHVCSRGLSDTNEVLKDDSLSDSEKIKKAVKISDKALWMNQFIAMEWISFSREKNGKESLKLRVEYYEKMKEKIDLIFSED